MRFPQMGTPKRDDQERSTAETPTRAKRVRPQPPPPSSRAPSAELSERARLFVDTFGTSRARVMLGGVSAEALARVVARMPVQRGTIAVIERALEKRDRAARARGEDGVT